MRAESAMANMGRRIDIGYDMKITIYITTFFSNNHINWVQKTYR